VSTRSSLAAYERRWLALHGNTRGAIWILVAGFMTTVQSLMVKQVGTDLHVFQVVFLRCLFGLSILLPLAFKSGLATFRTGRVHLHLMRAGISLTSMACSFYAFAHLPLADATAYGFTIPLFMIPIAMVMFGEKVRWRRWTATFIGFAGVLIMVRPDGAVHLAVPIALIGAFFNALVMAIIKRLTGTERIITLMTYFTIIGTLIALIPAMLVWRTPTYWELLLLFGMGLTGTLSQMFAAHGWYAATEATAIAPFDYSRLLYAVILGFIFFAEIPGLNTAAGALIIAGSTLYIARREARLRRAACPKAPAGPPPEAQG
jgi:drug/metabolite transporter (DMT)-like permease